MRIFTIDRHPSSKNGGQEWSLLDECAGLAGRGHDLTLGFIRDGDLLERHRAAGVRTVRLDAVELTLGSRARSGFGMIRSLTATLGLRADVICLNQYHDTFFGRAMATLHRVPLVCHLRLTPPDYSSTQWRLGLAGVQRFIAVSHSVRDEWARRGGIPADAIDVVHDGIDTNRFQPAGDRRAFRESLGVPPNTFMIAFAGRIDHSKNIEALLRAFAALRSARVAACLVIAGRPVAHATPKDGQRYLESLRQLACELGVADAVRWIGARDDVPALLSAADSAALFAYDEPFGRATVEALACGTPIVAHRKGGTSEILTGEFARWAFDLDDPAQPVAMWQSLLGWRERDPDLATRMRRHVLDNFSVDAMVVGTERTLASVIDPR